MVTNDSWIFAHKAPVWVPATDEVFFASVAGGHRKGGMERNNRVSKINLKEVEDDNLIKYTIVGPVIVCLIRHALRCEVQVPLADDIQMTSGGTSYRGEVLFANSGRGTTPPSLALVHPIPPYNSTTLLNNYYGDHFNSINDVKIHPTSQAIFFTDTMYARFSTSFLARETCTYGQSDSDTAISTTSVQNRPFRAGSTASSRIRAPCGWLRTALTSVTVSHSPTTGGRRTCEGYLILFRAVIH